MPKQSVIQIVDAKGGYRVKFVGKNGEPLMNSEVLESVAAVHKNILASVNCGVGNPWATKINDCYNVREIEDLTSAQKIFPLWRKTRPCKEGKTKG